MGFTYRLELRLKTLKLQLAAEVAIPLEHLYRLYLTVQRLHFLPDCVAKKQNLPSCKNSMLHKSNFAPHSQLEGNLVSVLLYLIWTDLRVTTRSNRIPPQREVLLSTNSMSLILDSAHLEVSVLCSY